LQEKSGTVVESDESNIVVQAIHYNYWHPQCSELTLKDIVFEVHKGEFVLLAGPSGCGKSTMALCLMGIRPGMLLGRADGDLLVNGLSSMSRPVHQIAQDMNIVFQSPDDQISNLTVEDELVFGLENRQMSVPAMEAKLKEVLEVCQLDRLKHREVWRLSGGEKQRVAMASILALEPPILLLDEPTSNLDPQGAQEVWDMVERIRDRYHSTIILVQHNIDSVLPNVDRVLLMNRGELCFDGSPDELVRTFGWRLRDEWGLWLPQATEVGLSLQSKGIELPRVPLGTQEAQSLLGSVRLDPAAEPEPGEPDCSVRPKSEEATAGQSQGTASRAATPWLKVEGLRFRYHKDAPEVLKGISLSVGYGEKVFIVGPNGAGKSTLAMQLIGLLKPTQGRITIDDQDTMPLSPAQVAHQIAYVFQYPEHQFIANSVYQEVAHGPTALKWAPERIADKTEEMLRRIGLWDYRERHPFSLSMGQKRRLSVACMLIMEPRAIILDEPTFGQDWRNANELMLYLQSLNEEGTTVMCITHDMRLVAECARRVLVVCDGQIAFDGSPGKLFMNRDVLARASLQPPPIFTIGEEILGRGVLSTESFLATLENAESLTSVGGQVGQ
jgi:energy-coupling factor transporter ATP-binding protein EcfA2